MCCEINGWLVLNSLLYFIFESDIAYCCNLSFLSGLSVILLIFGVWKQIISSFRFGLIDFTYIWDVGFHCINS